MAALQSFQARQGIRVIMATLFVVDLNVLALMGNGCPSLAAPANGRVRISSGTAWYSCNNGYSIRGPYKRTCTNGRWAGYTPSCKRDCPTLSRLVNGRVSVKQDVATYTCNYGYSLRGLARRVCKYGRWSGYSPTCVGKCPSLSNPTNGRVSINGRTATYTCDSRYTLRGSAVRQCSGSRWSGYVPTCLQSCLVLRSPLNGRVSIDDEVATYSCDYLYRLEGKKQQTCQNSVWNGKPPICVNIRIKAYFFVSESACSPSSSRPNL
ncbi:clotting factor C-like [Corticium candelabrum]|uniref:clotting factor C-like n=1 Tax=Corticium candelabrum TaxID=121492 RepID=UPI002E2762C8|nr:clotting factor C-like [Corticium candelabrum]